MDMSSANVDLKTLKRQVKMKKKMEKAAKKKEKKARKVEKKIKKREKKREKKARALMKKMGVEPPEAGAGGGAEIEVGGEQMVGGIEWALPSGEKLEKVEKQLDRLFEPRGEEIRRRWEEKYGTPPDIPDELLKPVVKVEEVEGIAEEILSEEPVEKPAAAEKAGWLSKLPFGRIGKAKTRGIRPARAAPGPGAKGVGGIMELLLFRVPPRGLYLYQKYGANSTNKAVKGIVFLISLVLWFPMLIIRIPITIIWFIIRTVKNRKSAAA